MTLSGRQQANPPPQDSRRDYFYFRKQCYDLIFKVIIAADNLAAHDPGVVDGQLTIIAKRKNEAYGVISDSTDEVFLTSLYDWYLEQGWSDRLLQNNSPFVVTYLERKSADDIAHADLLWRYFAQSQRFYEAANVQYHLAQSAFALPLARRIEYLGRPGRTPPFSLQMWAGSPGSASCRTSRISSILPTSRTICCSG